MRIQYLKHHEAFDIGYIAQWAKENNFPLKGCDLSKKELLPSMDEFDMLVVLGGAMGAYEEGRYLWIKQERNFIGEAIKRGKYILAFGLGAQILAQSLRGDIHKNPYREIGFGEVRFNKEGRDFCLLKDIPEKITALHWHKDLFDIPRDGHLLAKSKACKYQAFRFHKRVMGLQFHLETTPETLTTLIKKCRCDIVKGQNVHNPNELEANAKKCKNMHNILARILNNYVIEFNNNNN